jgi:HAE1 family hydrophobic/amphiphilic exporter-1
VRIKFDADLAQKLGVNTGLALSNISWALRGFQLSRFQETGREIPLIIEYNGTELAGLNTLRELEVRTGASAVPLSSFAELGFGSGSRSIQRHNGQATVNLRARCDNPARAKELYETGVRALGALDLPRGVEIAEDDSISTRQSKEMLELALAGVLALVLVFLLMGILFESFLLPISVLFTIPFAVMGSMWTMYITGTAMDSVGWIGVIILLGVVANHGIVLIDRIHGLRRIHQSEAGVDRAQSVLEGCRQRVRPVLMTSLTAVVGLLPMALTEPPGEGIDYRALATCVAGGLALSTVFTLWIVPLAYTVLDDLAAALSRQMSTSLRRPERTAAVTVAVEEARATS